MQAPARKPAAAPSPPTPEQRPQLTSGASPGAENAKLRRRFAFGPLRERPRRASPCPSVETAATSDRSPAPRVPIETANLPKRNAQHLAPPKTMDMKVRHPPTPDPDAANGTANSETPPSRDPTHPIDPPRPSRTQDWDDWGVSSAFSAIGDVVSTFTSDPPSKSPGVVRFPRAPAAGAAPAPSGGTPSKATVEHFVAATSFEAVSMVGRAAMFLGNAVVDGIEGTAELVQNAAKKADRIAMNVARCVPRRNTPRFPSLGIFFHPSPSRFPKPESHPEPPSHARVSPPHAAPTAHLAATPPARAALTRGAISATRTRTRTFRPIDPAAASPSAVACSRRSRTFPPARDARTPAVPRRPPNAPPRSPRVRRFVKTPPRGRPGRGRRRARPRRRFRRRRRVVRQTTAKIGVGARRLP
jgi:hypothetical protein